MSEYTGVTPPASWGFPRSAEEQNSGSGNADGAQSPGTIQSPDATEAPQQPEVIVPPGEETTAAVDETTEATAAGEETTEAPAAGNETTEAPAAGNETTETYASVGVDGKAGPEPTHVWCFVIMGVLAALCLGLLTALIAGAFRPRKRRGAPAGAAPIPAVPMAPVPAAPLPASGVIQAGKLHYQGDRESQQDCMAVSPLEMYASQGVLAVVADGMGGLSDGDQMSQAAVTAMMEGFLNARETDPLALTIRANQAVNALLGPARLGSSGTTLVAGIARDGLFRYVSVGDSRICLFRRGSLIQLNREHIFRNELATRAINGMGTLWDAETHPKAGGLTSYLGMGELKYVDIPDEPLRLERGDRIILMSDGVYNALTQAELESALGQPAQSAADTIARMIQVKAYRNQDNYTAIILEF